jgi:hypothetical protein
MTLNNNDTTGITIEFSPVKAQSYKTRLVIESNSIKDPVKYLNISGTGGPVSISESGINSGDIRIYPNPVTANDLFIINENNWEPGTKIRLLDIFGNSLIQTNVSEQSKVLKLNISNIQTGTYFIRTKGRNYNNTIKVVIVK